jgi:hypothetical protein
MNDATSPNCRATCFTTQRKVAEVVGGGERVGVAEVDLVLAVRDLVVRGLDLEAHALQQVDHGAPRVLAEVDGREVEVAADVVRLRRGAAVGAGAEEEELGLHPGLHREAQPGGRASIWRLSTARGSPANGVPSGMVMSQITRATRASGSPHGRTRKVARSGPQEHVALLGAHEPLDRAAVEHDVAGQRLAELRRRHLDVLVDAEDVGELEAQEAHVLGTRAREHVVGRDAGGGGGSGLVGHAGS